MKIQIQDIYYGAALQQIAEYSVFTSINKDTEKAGLYLINDSIRLLIKYSTEAGPDWSFSFTLDDLDQRHSTYNFFVVLNCGNDSICLLADNQLIGVLDSNAQGTQTVKISYHEGESIRVSGPLGKLSHTIPHNAFPMAMLGRVLPKQEKFAWPELGTMMIYDNPPEIIHSSKNRLEDLSDLLASRIGGGDVTVYIGFSTISHKWTQWNRANIKRIEGLIKYDLNFDGFNVEIEQHTIALNPTTKKLDQPCLEEFIWKLNITNM